MQNRFGKFDAVFYQEIMLLSGVFRRETASHFTFLHLVAKAHIWDNENGDCPFLVGKGEPPSLSSYFNFTFTCDLSIQRRREI